MADRRIIDSYLEEMVNKGASDLFITQDCAPSLRIDNKIIRIGNKTPITQADVMAIMDSVLNDEQLDEFKTTNELNIAVDSQDGERFRVNIFRQRHNCGLVIRHVKSVIPTFDYLGLPSIYKGFIMEKRGLILIVGGTGSGKSTSLAAMLQYRNENGEGHVITVEDPIEYYYEHKNCIFTQREIGVDTYAYGIALKNALLQSPDVIVIGEIRDRETMENALLFCEAGHLVIATLHSNNANQAIERIINIFPEELHRQLLVTLSQNLRAIFSQRLVESTKNARVLAYEIMINEGLIRNLIEEGKIKEIKEIMEKSRDMGMITFDQCLFDLFQAGKISKDVALREADNPNNLRLRMRQSSDGMSSNGNIKLAGNSDF